MIRFFVITLGTVPSISAYETDGSQRMTKIKRCPGSYHYMQQHYRIDWFIQKLETGHTAKSRYGLTTDLFLLFLISIMAMTCTTIYHKSKFSLLHTPFQIDQISFRTDGFYYTEHMMERHDYYWSDDGKRMTSPGYWEVGIQPMFFYADGYVKKEDGIYYASKYSDSVSQKNVVKVALIKLERKLIQESKEMGQQTDKISLSDWGRYSQEKETLKIQYYINHFGQYRLIELDGKVLDSTTIMITHEFSPNFPAAPHIINNDLAVIYKFRPFSIKPDSINYIKRHLSKFER